MEIGVTYGHRQLVANRVRGPRGRPKGPRQFVTPEEHEARRRRFASARERLRASLHDVGGFLGVSLSTASAYERGQNSVPLHQLAALENAALDQIPRTKAFGPKTRDTSRDEDIRSRLHAGESLEGIGRSYGVTRERIRQIAKLAGVVWARRMDVAHERREMMRLARAAERRTRNAIRNDMLARAREMVDRGMSIRQALLRVGFKETTIHALSAVRGWPTQHGRHRPEIKERTEKILPLYMSGSSIWNIGERLGMPAFNVRGFLLRHGVVLREEDLSRRRKPLQPQKERKPPKKHDRIVSFPLGRPSVWTAKQLALLAERWNAGVSARVIAQELGPTFTRNAVIGQINRQRRKAGTPA